jgi:hypothetical protein
MVELRGGGRLELRQVLVALRVLLHAQRRLHDVRGEVRGARELVQSPLHRDARPRARAGGVLQEGRHARDGRDGVHGQEQNAVVHQLRVRRGRREAVVRDGAQFLRRRRQSGETRKKLPLRVRVE